KRPHRHPQRRTQIQHPRHRSEVTHLALQSVIAFYINYTALLMQARLVTPSRAYYLTTATMPAPFKRISDIEDMDEEE
ncbi:MAG: hypothetical protein MR822_07250, partial [Bacteroidales bacterium]|nr:hypothetical protein [Bacteroidales bacterium]